MAAKMPVDAQPPSAALQPPVQVALVGQPVAYTWRPPAEPAAARKYYGSWSSSLFGCCADPLWCCGFLFCFPFAIVLRVQSIVEKVGSMNIPLLGVVDRSNALMYGVLALVFAWFGGIPYVLFLFLIYKGVQGRFGIQKSDVGIGLEVLCCSCCSLLRLGRHVDGYDDALKTAEHTGP